MLDAQGEVLYVGKARNLKNRVTSYFRAAGLQAKTMAMVARIHNIEVTVTQSETEALLLEQSLIKAERPPYNIVLRDDKSYPFIHLTAHKDYPRLTFHRGAKSRKGRYFGPFPSAYAVRDSLNILQRLFRIRNCDDTYFKNRSRPCLQYQIKRCTGPCVGLVDPEAYQEDVELAVLFLEGRSQNVLDAFKTKMDEASQALDFERAARYRDQISHLRKVQEAQYVHGEKGDVDVFALATASGAHCVQGLFIRGGRMLGQRSYYPKNELGLEDGELLHAFLSQFYLGSNQRDIPRTIIVSALPARDPHADTGSPIETQAQTSSEDSETPATEHATGRFNDAQHRQDVFVQALSREAGRKVALVSDVRTERARWLNLAMENARIAVETHVADRRNTFSRFTDLQEQLGLATLPSRLECFDISHTMGEATVASCVVFDTNGPAKSDYRRFNIEGITPGDDYAAMEQALRRRFKRIKAGEVQYPDLLVIDGGPGQLNRAVQVLDELEIDHVNILGIAKGPDRKAGLEKIYLNGDETGLEGTSAAAHLIQHIRDEAHRFAITGHRTRRNKQRTRSELDDIDGVGPKRRKELLSHFGSLRGVKGASMEEIAKVPGINAKLAQQIYERLHQ